MELRFLGREHPPLEVVSRYLLEEHDLGFAPGPCDLRHLTVVLGGKRSGRLFLRPLVEAASAGGRGLLPPAVVTPGRLPECLLELEGPIASTLASTAAMIESLRKSPGSVVEELIPGNSSLSSATLLPIASLLSSTRAALASASISFEKAALIASNFDSAAARRLHCAQRVDDTYREILDGYGLTDRDDAIATAIAAGVRQQEPVILISVTEVPPRLQQILDLCREAVVILHARESSGDRYDRYGQPIPEAWQKVETPPLVGRFVSATTPARLARVILDVIAASEKSLAIEEVAIGVADSDLSPWLQETFRRCGIALHDAAGSSFSSSTAGTLLETLAGSGGELSAETAAALVRHPDIHRRLDFEGEEDFAGRYAPDSIAEVDRWRSRRHPTSEADHQAPAAIKEIGAALAPLSASPRALSAWADPLRETIANLVGDAEVADGSWQALASGIEKLALLPDGLADSSSSADAISLLSDSLTEKQLPSEYGGPAMEMLGWLELELDDSPLLVVSGVAEGKIGAADGSDALLSEGLKKELGIAGSDQRSARDAHILDAILDSPRTAVIACASRDAEGTPLLPSRLLLRSDEAETLLRTFLDDPIAEVETPLLDAPLLTSPVELGIPVPESRGKGPERVSVTAFRDWLTCPVLFWLRRVLKVESLHDRDRELDAISFGKLLHDTVEAFGDDPVERDLDDVDSISKVLEAHLESMVARRLANPSLAAVAVQVEQARARLKQFAVEQAALRQEGWRIIAVEAALDGDLCALDTEAGPLAISGRIDRIDLHEETGRIRILDYKTGDSGKSPDKDHLKGKGSDREWTNLQLPLYRHFADRIRGKGIPDPFPEQIEVGYLLLPRSGSKSGLALAKWSDDEHEEAIELACREGARILRGDLGDAARVVAAPFERAFVGVVIDPESQISGKDGEEAE